MTEPDNNDPPVASSRGEFIFYQTEDRQTRVECRFEEATIWLSQALMAKLSHKEGVAQGSKCRSDK